MSEPSEKIVLYQADLVAALRTADRLGLPDVALQVSKAIDALMVVTAERSKEQG